mmetsp:Transcript_29152/g.93099  ORF Transcript_29152/g.93099 Transcript_29152/m.93099 type:complete len:176 (-) Transcript_29152:135-662(-)
MAPLARHARVSRLQLPRALVLAALVLIASLCPAASTRPLSAGPSAAAHAPESAIRADGAPDWLRPTTSDGDGLDGRSGTSRALLHHDGGGVTSHSSLKTNPVTMSGAWSKSNSRPTALEGWGVGRATFYGDGDGYHLDEGARLAHCMHAKQVFLWGKSDHLHPQARVTSAGSTGR